MEKEDVAAIAHKIGELSLDIYAPTNSKSSIISPPLPLSPRSKHDYLTSLLERDAPLFLEKFGKHLAVEELNLFSKYKPLQDNYEVNWHLKQLFAKFNTSKSCSSKLVAAKNRRYSYMQSLIKEGDYFSDESVKRRYPYLYHEYVGKYEPQKRYPPDLPLSERLIDNIQEDQIGKIMAKQQEMAESALEEEEEDSDDEQAHNEEGKAGEEAEGDGEEEGGGLAASEKAELRSELLNIVYGKFLNGEDVGFDYPKVDDDPNLDSQELMNQDEESKYFSDDSDS